MDSLNFIDSALLSIVGLGCVTVFKSSLATNLPNDRRYEYSNLSLYYLPVRTEHT